MTDANASSGELVAVAREFARKGGTFPTPGQIVEAIRERRIKALQEERDQEWRKPRALPPAATPQEGGYPPEGWTRGRSMADTTKQIEDLIRRGHKGSEQGERYTVAVLREEREAAEAAARGEVYAKKRYGPSLLQGNLLRRGAGL